MASSKPICRTAEVNEEEEMTDQITTIHNPRDVVKKDGKRYCRKCQRFLK